MALVTALLPASTAAASTPAAVTASLTSAAAQATGVSYSVSFTTSASGALSGGTGTISLSGASGTVFGTAGCDYVLSDTTKNLSPSSCPTGVTPADSGAAVSFTLPSGFSPAAGDSLIVTAKDVTNPSAGSDTVSVSTSSDTTPAPAPAVAVTAAQAVANVGMSLSSLVGSQTNVTYTAGFDLSSTGGLVGGAGTVSLSGASGTVFPSSAGQYEVTDETTGSSAVGVGNLQGGGGNSVSFALPSAVSASGGDNLNVVVSGVTNPPATAETFTVATSSDSLPASSQRVVLSGNPGITSSVTNASLAMSTVAEGATGTTYTVSFVASADGGLARGGAITLVAPVGTVFDAGNQCDHVTDTTTNQSSGGCDQANFAGDGSIMTVFSGVAIQPGDAVTVTASNVSNPEVASTTLSVSTASDGVFDDAPSVALSQAGTVGSASLAVSTTAEGATQVTDTVGFTASGTGALEPGSGSITLQGTGSASFPGSGNCAYTVTDERTGDSNCAPYAGTGGPASGSTVTIGVPNNVAIAAGDAVQVVVNGAGNPAAAAFGLAVSTSSDLVPASTSASLVAPKAVTLSAPPNLSLSTTAAGAGGVVATLTLAASSLGALVSNYGDVTLTGPPGTSFPGNRCDYAFDDVSTQHTQGCAAAVSLGNPDASTVTIVAPLQVRGSDALQIVVSGLHNPGVGSDAMTVSTSSDTVPATTSAVTLVAPQAVTPTSQTVSPAVTSAGGVAYGVGFSTSSTGALRGGSASVTLTGSPGTRFPGGGCEYTFYDATTTTTSSCVDPTSVAAGGSVVDVPVPAGFDVRAGDTVVVSVVDVVDPPSSSQQVSVATSSDVVPAAESATALSPGTSVSSPGLTVSSPVARAADVTDTVTFTATTTIGADGVNNDGSISLVATPGTFLPGDGCQYTLTDISRNRPVNCVGVQVFADGSHADISLSQMQIRAGDQVSIAIANLTNPAAGSTSFSVETNGDPVPVSTPPVTLAAAKAPASVGLGLSQATAGATGVTYTVDFSASSQGALIGGGGWITVVATPGTAFSSNGNDYILSDLTTKHSQTGLRIGVGRSPNMLEVQTPFPVNSGDQVELVAAGVTNATVSSETVQVMTSSDLALGSSAGVALGGGASPSAVTALTLTPSDTVANEISATASVSWTATSSSAPGEGVSIVGSPGLVFNGSNSCSYYLDDSTSGTSVQLCGAVEQFGPGSEMLSLTTGSLAVAAGDHLSLSIPQITNASGSETVGLATTADPALVTSAAVSLSSPASVGSPTLSLSRAGSGSSGSTWVVSFDAHSALDSSQQIDVAASPGTSFPGNAGCSIVLQDVTTGHSTSGNCIGVSRSYDGQEISVGVTNSFSIAAGDAVELTVPGVQNPPGSSASVTVWTSSDTVPVSSAPSALAAGGSPSAGSASLSSAAAGASWVTGTFDFTTSATGGLVPGDWISLRGSPGVVFPGFSACEYTITDLTTSNSVNCVPQLSIAAGGSAATFAVPNGLSIASGDRVAVDVAGMDNPVAGEDGSGAGTVTFQVATAADPGPVTAGSLPLAAPQAPGSGLIGLSNATEGASGVTVTASFVASATNGGLAGASAVTLSGAPGTTWPGNGCDYTVTDVSTGHSRNCVQGLSSTGDGSVVTITTEDSFTLNPGDQIDVVVTGVSNPSGASDTLGVSTSSDPVAATNTVALSPAGSVTTPALTVSSPAAGAVDVSYTVGFDTSPTGQMANGAGEIDLVAAPGTRFPTNACDYTVTDHTNTDFARCVGSLAVVASGAEVAFQIGQGFSIAAGDQLSVQVTGVTNPASGGGDTVSVATSSDPVAVASGAVAFAAAAAPSSASLSTTSGAVGQTGVTYSVGFTASASGALASGSGTITLVAEAGTSFGNNGGGWCATVADTTTGRSSSCDPATISGDGAAVTVTTDTDVHAGDAVVVSLTGVTNPPVQGTDTARVWTSSDLVPVAVSLPVLSGEAISGTVQTTSNGTTTAVGGVEIEACPMSGGACVSGGTTSGGGAFSIAVGPGDYMLQATPPAAGGSGALQAAEYGPVTISSGGSVTGIVINMPPQESIPSGASVNGQTSGVPTIFWGSASSITVTGCPDGMAVVLLQGRDEQSGATVLRTVPLTETPPGSGTYTGTVPPMYPVHGNVTVGSMVYCAPLTGVLPYAGPATGGTQVTITGAGFTGATAVHFGAAAATSVKVVSDSEITAVAPPGNGTVDVTVTTPAGTTPANSLAQFTYSAVASVAPDTGNTSGGGTVLITGAGFSSAEQVYFGTTRALFTVVDPTEIIAMVPPASGAGTVDVTVETSGGSTPTSGADRFTYSTTAPAPSTPQQLPTPPESGGTPPVCSSSGGPSVCAAPPQQRISNAPPLSQGFGGSLSDPGAVLSTLSGGAPYATTSGNTPPDNTGNWTPILHWSGGTDWIGSTLSGAENLNSILDGSVFASDIAAEEDFNLALPSLSDTLASLISDTALENSFVDFALGPVGGVALAAFQIYCQTSSPTGVLGGVCAVANVPTAVLDWALTNSLNLLQKLWNEFIDPSGTIVDDKGNPIAGATVTILGSSSGAADGPYAAIPDGSVTIQPGTNPETSSSTGQFAWNVVPGWYEIEATKTGCNAPGSPGQPDAVTPAFEVPPPQDGLRIVLSCQSEPTPPPPAVTGLSIATGPATGGTLLSIAGTGFTASSTVDFGGSASPKVTVVSPTDIQAVSPAGTGTVDVTVANGSQVSGTGQPDQFSYVSAPVVSSLSSHTGTSAGGSVVEINGSGFAYAQSVEFGGVAAINFEVLSGTQIRATTPPGSGTVDVTVASSDGPSTISSADRWTYAAPLRFSTTSLPPALAGVPYSFALKATGGVAPYRWKLASGSLPPGMSLSSVGTISGKPSKTGTYHLGVRLSDSDVPAASVTAEMALVVKGPGYWMATSAGTVYGFGSARSLGSVRSPAGPVVGLAAAAPKSGSLRRGYWLATSKGAVYHLGAAAGLGHPSHLASAVTAIAAAPKGMGYWLVTAKGVVYAYGTAKFHGDEKRAPSSAVVGIAPTPSGTGYWLVTKSGSVYAFGKAKGHGSVRSPAGSVVGIASDAAGTGYWVVTSKGVVYHFGTAHNYGGERKAPSPAVVGMAVTPTGTGYWLCGAGGKVYGFGSAKSLGVPRHPGAKVVGIAAD